MKSISTFFLMTFAITQMEVMLALFMGTKFGFSAENTGYLFASLGMLMVLMQGGLIGRLTRRFGENALIISGLCIGAVALIAMGWVHSLAITILLLALLSMTRGVLHPSLSSLTSKAAPTNLRGATMGVFHSASSLGRVLGPPLAGWLFDRMSPGAPFFSGGCILILGMLVFRRRFSRQSLGSR